MIRAVADTHTIVWYLFEDRRLSRPALETMEGIAATAHALRVPLITKDSSIWRSTVDTIW